MVLKKAIISLIIILMFFGSCSKQSSIYIEKIIGTWVTKNETIYVFKSNGTLTVTAKDTPPVKYEFIITDTELSIGNGKAKTTHNFSMSPDEKTVTLTFRLDETDEGIFLTRK